MVPHVVLVNLVAIESWCCMNSARYLCIDLIRSSV